MKANKVTVTIKVEVLSTDTVLSFVQQMLCQYDREFHNGSLTADDGDTVAWSTKQEEATI